MHPSRASIAVQAGTRPPAHRGWLGVSSRLARPLGKGTGRAPPSAPCLEPPQPLQTAAAPGKPDGTCGLFSARW